MSSLDMDSAVAFVGGIAPPAGCSNAQKNKTSRCSFGAPREGPHLIHSQHLQACEVIQQKDITIISVGALPPNKR